MLFERYQRIVCIGDSITDCGRRQEAALFGNGYVSLIRAFLLARYPALNVEIFNEGISGNTIRDLAQRWTTDVINHRPHWVSIMIGINDVWRWMSGRYSEAVSLDEYHETYKHLLERTASEIQAKLILLQPFLVEPTAQDPFRSRLEPYIAVVAAGVPSPQTATAALARMEAERARPMPPAPPSPGLPAAEPWLE